VSCKSQTFFSLNTLAQEKGRFMKQVKITIQTRGKGLHPITSKIRESLSGLLGETGLLNIFITHTSASLIIQENADPTARQDLESFMDRLVPDDQAWHRHTLEGPDDTTSHMKSVLTQVSLNIPINSGQLALGTWQGIYLWEHRSVPHNRNLILTVLS